MKKLITKLQLLILTVALVAYLNPVHAGTLDDATVFHLENGMEVILVENHANPMITAFTIVRAGSRLEDEAMNGAAHFLEHLLFNGTTKRTQKELYDEMDFYGGYNNASTGPDYTSFMILMPKEYIAEGMDIQADMLFNSTLPAEKFEKERGIVIEEIGQDSDKATYQVQNQFLQTFFAGTNFSRPVLGTTSTIRHLPYDRVMNYYKTWYVPNNMTMMVIGDFNTEEMIQIVKEKYGAAAAGPLPELAPIELKKPAKPRVQKATAMGKFPEDKKYLRIGYALPSPSSDDFQVLEMMTEFLGGKETSFLQKAFAVEMQQNQLTSIGASMSFNREFSYLEIAAELSVDADHNRIAEKIQQTVKNFGQHLVPKEDIDLAMIANSTDEIFTLEKLHYYGMVKSAYLAAGGFELLQNYQQGLEQITPIKIQAAVKNHLSGQTPVMTLMRPRKKKADAQATTSVDSYHTETLANGLQVVINYNADSPVIGVHLLARERFMAEGTDKAGMTAVLQRMLNSAGTKKHPGEAFTKAMERVGGELKIHDLAWIPYDDYYTTPRFAYMRLKLVDKQFEPGLTLLADLVQNAQLEDKDVAGAKKEVLGIVGKNSASTPKIAEKLFYDNLLQSNPGYGLIYGTMQTVQPLQLADLKNHYNRFYNPANLILTISGDIPTESALATVKSLFAKQWGESGWQAEKPSSALQNLGRTERTTVGKKQSYIYLADTFKTQEKDRAALDVLLSIFSDRITFELRERQGLAYRMGATEAGLGDSQWYEIRMGTSPENIDKAIAGLKEQIVLMRTAEVDSHEVQKTINALLGRRGMRRLDRVGKAYYISMEVFAGRSADSDEKYGEALKQVTVDDIKRLAPIVFAGDEPLVVIAE
ncbi:insulinase family protein [candidate division KSB1 bacterium]|nr:insulinase family protein [candidate division KSB1 bacterium]